MSELKFKPKESRKVACTHFFLPPEIYKEFKERAKQDGMTMQSVFEQFVEWYNARPKEPPVA